MINTPINPGSLLALGGIGAIVAAFWGYVRMVWDYISSFVVGNAICRDTNVEIILFSHLWKTYPKTSLVGRLQVYGSIESIRETGRTEQVACESKAQRRWIFWINGRPLLWNKVVKTNGEHTNAGLVWIRGTVDLRKIMSQAMIAYRHLGDAVVNPNGTNPRFQVKLLYGHSKDYFGMLAAGQGMGKGQEGSSTGGGTPAAGGQPTPVAVNGSWVTDRLWREACDYFNYSYHDFGRVSAIKAIDILSLDEEAAGLVQECERWMQSEEWFRTRGVPWRRGALLYGPPGTGKTSLLRGIAQRIDVPVFVFDLGTMNNSELQSNWSNAVANAPCMIVIEDIDGVFEGRENVTGENGGGLTFDALLNCIDGIGEANGVLLAITTNRIEMVDPALGRPTEEGSKISTRPGRIDRVICLKNPDEGGRRKIADRILRDWPEHIETIVAAGSNDTGAQFQYRCVQLAQGLFWESKK